MIFINITAFREHISGLTAVNDRKISQFDFSSINIEIIADDSNTVVFQPKRFGRIINGIFDALVNFSPCNMIAQILGQ